MEAQATIKNKNRRKTSLGDRIFLGIITAVLILFIVIEVYPLIYVISASVSDPDAVTSGEMVLFPIGINFKGYQFVFQYKEIWTGYMNTILYTVAGTAFSLFLTIPAAYALSRPEFRDRKFFLVLFMITMYFSGGLIPTYLNYKSFGLVNTRLIMIITGGLSVYNLIVARTFFANSIPNEMCEAAKVDGASDFRILSQIVLPISKAIIVVLMLYYAVARWNSYFEALVYVSRTRAYYPLQLVLREILIKSNFAKQAMGDGVMDPEQMELLLKESKDTEMVKYCIIIVSTLPMMIVYPFLQKFFEKGVMIGAVKG